MTAMKIDDVNVPKQFFFFCPLDRDVMEASDFSIS
jgi:hypothetical protein